MSTKKLTIGTIAKEAQVTVETIRFYERKKLIKQPEKQGGFRYYTHDYITHIRFIKRSQNLGFNLAEIKELLALSFNNQGQCADFLKKAQEKIEEIDKKIADLEHIKTSLENLKKCCKNPHTPINECSIFDMFKEKK